MLKIETDRLVLTPYTEADRASMASLHCDPEIMQWMKGKRALTESEAGATFDHYLRCWARDDVGIMGVRLKETEEFIGECGFWFRGDRPGAAMRYLLKPAYWGNGMGREMTEAATKWLFTQTHVDAFWAITKAYNKNSAAILRRLGGILSDETDLGEDELCLFEVPRTAWEKSMANKPEAG